MRATRRGILLGALALVTAGVAAYAAPGQGHANGKGHEHGPKKRVVNGTVTVVSATGVTVHRNGKGPGGEDVTVLVDDSTKYRRTDGADTSGLADISVGTRVQVKGPFDGVNLNAAQVLIKVPDPGDDTGTDPGGDDGSGNTPPPAP